MSERDLHIEAVHLWGRAATRLADDSIRNIESLMRELDVYDGMDSAGHFVTAGLADAAEALGYLRRARAAIGPIVDARLAEERAR